ncbi:TetR/AcrR family transcriptional regulator [Lacticaseibacillus thailandensis]|nr:TetR/AcrR family transcriptional regulator [Lacticaseibacillus thailandensis]
MTESTNNVFMDYREWVAAQPMPPGKRKALLAGLAVFAANGYDGASTQQIADAAGISQATIFKYFKTKRDLLTAIVTPIITNMFGAYQSSFVDHLPTTDDLQTLLDYVVTDRLHFLQVNADAFVILFSQLLTNRHLREEGFTKWLQPDNGNAAVNKAVGTFKHLQQVGQIRPEMTVGDVIRAIAGPLFIYFLQGHLLGQLGPTDTARDLAVLKRTIYNSMATHPITGGPAK